MGDIQHTGDKLPKIRGRPNTAHGEETMWIVYIMMGVLGFCWLTLLLDIFCPGWDRD